MTDLSTPVCEVLAWDTNFFGIRIARVRADALTTERLQSIEDFCQQNQVRCLYFLSTIQEPGTARLAEEYGFQWVDIRLTFEIKTPTNPVSGAAISSQNSVRIRPVKNEDVAGLVEISNNSYVDSRFYFDRNFPRERAAALYQTWIKVSCEGWANAVLIAEKDGLPAGYITCHIDPAQKTGNIGLVGVSSQAQGLGIGKALVFSALEWFTGQGIAQVTVVTQGRNVAAQRLYQRCGFITQKIQLWYHKWYPPV